MTNNNGQIAPQAPAEAERELHLVCSSGGSRAILASAGVLLAADYAGVKRFKSIGGVSGGSVPTALFAAGLDAKECVRTAIEIDFSSLLTRKVSYLQILMALLWQRRYEKVRPIDGAMTSEKLGEFIDSFSEVWPEGYWTVGIHENFEIIFNEAGIFKIGPDRLLRVVDGKPGNLGKAVRGSCAVPGVISAVEYDDMHLFDGALGTEGRCPVSLPTRLYGAKRTDIIACDVGDDTGNTSERITKLWKLICGDECVPDITEPDYHTDGQIVLIRPKITAFRTLQFSLTKDQKWQAVMAGFVDGLPELANAGILSVDKLKDASEVTREYQRILRRATTGKKQKEGFIARETEKLLVSQGLL